MILLTDVISQSSNFCWIVLDETTYYISAFAVDSNGTIIDVQSSSIQTDFFFAKYQKVEYVQSYGDQYIQTDIQAGNTKGAYMKVLCTNVYDDNIWFGASGSGDTRQVIGAQEKKIYLGWNAKSYTGISANTVYEAGLNYLNSRKATLNGNNVSNLGTLSSSNVYKFAIFGGNYLGTINPLKATIKLYELKLSEGTAITHDFVPVYRKSDSVIGMLDITNKVFYTNNGTGTFGKGSDVPR